MLRDVGRAEKHAHRHTFVSYQPKVAYHFNLIAVKRNQLRQGTRTLFVYRSRTKNPEREKFFGSVERFFQECAGSTVCVCRKFIFLLGRLASVALRKIYLGILSLLLQSVLQFTSRREPLIGRVLVARKVSSRSVSSRGSQTCSSGAERSRKFKPNNATVRRRPKTKEEKKKFLTQFSLLRLSKSGESEAEKASRRCSRALPRSK